MCMRPCGPVRSGGYREPKEITKKGALEILTDGKFESIELYKDGACLPYDAPTSRVRTAVRDSNTTLKIAKKSWDKEYKEGYRTIIVDAEEIYLIRCK